MGQNDDMLLTWGLDCEKETELLLESADWYYGNDRVWRDECIDAMESDPTYQAEGAERESRILAGFSR